MKMSIKQFDIEKIKKEMKDKGTYSFEGIKSMVFKCGCNIRFDTIKRFKNNLYSLALFLGGFCVGSIGQRKLYNKLQFYNDNW